MHSFAKHSIKLVLDFVWSFMSFVCVCEFKDLLIFLKGREREGERQRRKASHPVVHSPGIQVGLDQANVWGQKLLGFLLGWQEPEWVGQAICCYFPLTKQKLKWKWHSQVSNQHPYGIPVSQLVAIHAVSQCWPPLALVLHIFIWKNNLDTDRLTKSSSICHSLPTTIPRRARAGPCLRQEPGPHPCLLSEGASPAVT